MGKSGGKAKVYEYTMSMHIGICAAGEGLEMLAMKYGEKEIWRGSLTAETKVAINKPNLLGGMKKEGGVKGLLWWLPGGSEQVMPETLAAKLGLTTATCPGFRGLASIFMTGIRGLNAADVAGFETVINSLKGNPSNNRDGFYWGANNPYLRSMSVKVRRPPIGLNPAIAMIRMPDDSEGNAQYAANPAHIIYECMTNTDWGMGENSNLMDKDTYESVAQVLYDEGFGLNMIWTRQTEIGKFIGEVLTHIQGATYVDPAKGKHTIKLLRADYDVDALPLIHPGNADLTSFERKAWGEIPNEVTVTMTNPETGKEETVTAQDLAAIAAEGGIVPSSSNYYGVTSRPLATKLAERDLAAVSSPIATAEVTVTREFWDTVVKGVVKMSWPEYDIEQVVFRVSEVVKDENTVKLNLFEDVFGLDYASYLAPGSSEWVDPSQAPTPATYYQVGTAPAFFMASQLGLTDPSELVYPEVMGNMVVGADSDDDVNFDVVTKTYNVNGTEVLQNLGNRSYAGTWILLSELHAEPQSLLTELSGLRGPEPAAGDFILIGMGADEHTEIATVQSVDETGYLINRGMLDTVPHSWPIGTRAFVIPAASNAADTTIRAAGESASYWLLTRTTKGTLELADAPQINVTMGARPHLPNRPANLKVNGVGFGVLSDPAMPLEVTWANRNRILESTQATKWTDSDVAGEEGQTTKITVSTAAGTVLASYPALTETSLSIPLSSLAGNKTAIIRATSVCNGRESLQGHEIVVQLDRAFSSGFSTGFR